MAKFYDFVIRGTDYTDLPLASEWTKTYPRFWIDNLPNDHQSYLVSHDEKPLAFFRVEYLDLGNQARIAFQSRPKASPKIILRGITKLVPLIEQALRIRGVRAIFFTSHSSAMAEFMRKHLGYTYAGDGGPDGMMMAKGLK